MARKAYGLHATQVNLSSYPDDGTSPVGSAEWNEALDNEVMLGFSKQNATTAISGGALLITDTVCVATGEGGNADDLDSITLTNTSEYDIVYLFGQAGYDITLKHGGQNGSLNVNGEVSTVSGSDEVLSATKPTILIRVGNYWYGYGGGSASNLTTSSLAAATLVTESEGIGSNDNDTTLPTSAAVKDYVDTQVATEDTITELNDTTISSIGSGELLKWNGSAWINQTLAEAGIAASGAKLSDFAATSSSELAGTISDETGSGALVFATSPTFVTPALGTPASGVATNLTGTAASLTAGTVSDNAITLAKMSAGTDGNLISYDTNGDPVAVATGTATHVLTSNGAGAAPTFQAPAGGSISGHQDYGGQYDAFDVQRVSFEIQLNNFDDSTRTGSGQINDDLTGESQVYVKVIDSNNDGVFARLKKNGSIVNVQLA